MFCSQCGRSIVSDAKFCQYCGAKKIINSCEKIACDSDQRQIQDKSVTARIYPSFDGKLIQYTLRQNALIRSKKTLVMPSWIDPYSVPCPRVSIFITDSDIFISKSPEKSKTINFVENATLIGRMLGGPILGAIPHLIGEMAGASVNQKDSRSEWGKIIDSKELMWARRSECVHYECVKKGTLFGESYSHWCINGSFHFGAEEEDLLLIFGRQEKGGWAHFFQRADIRSNHIIEIDSKSLISEKFPQYPIPRIDKKYLDKIDF